MPEATGGAALALFLLGTCVFGLLAWLSLRRQRAPLRTLGVGGAAATAALLLAGGAVPLDLWRVGQDVRYTTGLAADQRAGAGPIEAFLQPYLLDDAARTIPPGATYAAVAGDAVPYAEARQAFPALALNVLFPRVSREPRRAEWLIAWGTDPRDHAEVRDIRVVTPRSGVYPPVAVARIVHPP